MPTSNLIHDPLTIYIIDDDPDDQQLLEEALLTVNQLNACHVFINAVEGLKKLHAGLLPLPDLIFVDMNMPLIDGRQFLKLMKGDLLLKGIPIVIYSTAYFQTEVTALLALGAASYLQKTSDFNLLKNSLHSIISILEEEKGINF